MVSTSGFRLKQLGAGGKCDVAHAEGTPETVHDDAGLKLVFNELTQMQCAVEFSLADLEAFCSGTSGVTLNSYSLF